MRSTASLTTDRHAKRGHKFSIFLTVTLVCFVCVCLILITGSLYGVVSESMTREFRNGLRLETVDVRRGLQDRLDAVNGNLRKLAHDNGLRVSLMLGVLDRVKRILREQYLSIGGTTYYILGADTDRFIPELPPSMAGLAPMLIAFSRQESEQHRYFYHLPNGPMVSVLSIPVVRKAEPLATVFAIYDISRDTEYWDRFQDRFHGRLLYFDSLTRSAMDLSTNARVDLPAAAIASLEPDASTAIAMGKTKDVVLRIDRYSGLYYMASFQPLEKRKALLREQILLMCLFVVALTLALSWIIAVKIGTPLSSMARQARALAKDPVPQYLSESELRYSEFQTLARAFNSVLRNVLEAREALREKAAKDLAASEDRFQQLVETSPAGILAIDDFTHRIVFANRTIERMSGFDRDTLQTLTFDDILQVRGWRRIQRESTEKAISGDEKLRQEVFEAELNRIDGSRVWTELWMAPGLSPDSGQIQFYIMDISSLRQVEAERLRLATAVEQASEGILITDAECRILFANPAFLSISGYQNEEVVGRTPEMLSTGASPSTIDNALRLAFADGTPWKGRSSHRRRDGTIFETQSSVSPIKDSSGQRVNCIIMMRDITHEVRLEDGLRQAQKMQAIGTLAGGIAHDFNNILSAIMGYTEISLADLPPGSPLVQRLGRVLQASERAKELIHQILTFSRKGEREEKPVPIAPLIEEILDLMRASLPATVRIETAIDAAKSIILADPTQIHQVVVNLCTNAAHAMSEKTGRLGVRLSREVLGAEAIPALSELKAGPYVHLEISDTGCGMDHQTMERIFEPFFSTKAQGEGTGMGLAVVHGIVKSHNGGIWAESIPGMGSTFHVLFPENAQAEMPSLPDRTRHLHRGSGRVLLVDDEEFMVEMGREMLERLGYTVLACNRSPDALTQFRQDPEGFDLVITDQIMPMMTGVDLAVELHTIRPDVPIILCTGYMATISAKRARALGIQRLLTKPFRLETIASAIRDAMEAGAH